MVTAALGEGRGLPRSDAERRVADRAAALVVRVARVAGVRELHLSGGAPDRNPVAAFASTR